MDMVVKDNALINASYTLSLVEQRIVLLAIIEARETKQGINTDTFLEIHAQHYADRFDISVKNAYAMLGEAAQALFSRQVTFVVIDEKRNKPEKRLVRWVSGVSYVDGSGVIKLRFAPEIIPLITQLEKNFTSYELSQVASLGLYATRLYELLIAWRSTGKVPVLSIDDFRSQLGILSNEYKTMSNFKARVLEPAIKQINEHTDIVASYTQHKTGRTITGFSFTFKTKVKEEKAIKKEQVKEKKEVKKVRLSAAWGMAEESLFKQLHKKCVGLTKQYIEQLAVAQNTDISMILNRMSLEYARVDSFELIA